MRIVVLSLFYFWWLSALHSQEKIKSDRGIYYGFHIGYQNQNIHSVNIGAQVRYARLNQTNFVRFHCIGINASFLNSFKSNNYWPGWEVNAVYMASFRKSDFGLYSSIGYSFYNLKENHLTAELGVNVINVFTLSCGPAFLIKNENIPINRYKVTILINVNNYWRLLWFRNYKKV